MSIADYTVRPVRFSVKGLKPGPGGGCWRVEAASPTSPRRAVWQAARMFRREFGYDVVQYGHDGREEDPDHVAFLWDDPRIGSPSGFDTYAIGACCFRLRRGAGYSGWAVQWAWFHPYFRRRGLLSAAWTGFRDEFGEFDIEPPYSAGMWAFVARHARWQLARIPTHVIAKNLPPDAGSPAGG